MRRGRTHEHEKVLTTDATDYTDLSHLFASQIRVIRCIRVIRGTLFWRIFGTVPHAPPVHPRA